MKRFSKYCQFREGEENGLGDIDAMPNEDEMFLTLAKMVISRHRERFVDFLNSVARHDEDIKSILGKVRDKQNTYLPQDLRAGSKEDEKDIVAPSPADSGEQI